MIQLMNYHTESGVKTVLVDDTTGYKWMKVLLIETPVCVRKVLRTDERYMKPADSRKGMKGIAKQYRTIGTKLGITKSAIKFLRKASAEHC